MSKITEIYQSCSPAGPGASSGVWGTAFGKDAEGNLYLAQGVGYCHWSVESQVNLSGPWRAVSREEWEAALKAESAWERDDGQIFFVG